jgi:NAD(P)-dependent dehydrogenase (short-subunit alcohol dehydrogenase family)
MKLEGKVAVITGAGSGIGRATALRLARDGASIVVADWNEAGANETASLVEAAGGKAAAIRVDVTKPADITKMLDFADATYGGFDILYNNAGVTTGQPAFPESPEAQWRRTVEIDLCAVIEGTRQAIPRLQKRGGGVIMQTASLAGLFGFQNDPVYAAAKHGVVGLTRALIGLKDQMNVRVNCVCPAVVRTPLVTSGLERLSGPERAEAEKRMNAMPMLPPEEIAEAVYEMIGDDDAAGVVMGVTLGNTRRVVDPPITLPVTSGTPGAQQRPRG